MLNHQERYEERAKASVCDHWGLALVAGLTGAFVRESQADVIKIESFEMKSPAETYTDPMDPGLDHVLVNQPRSSTVDHEGWSAWYRTHEQAGLADGDVFGVGQSRSPHVNWMDGRAID